MCTPKLSTLRASGFMRLPLKGPYQSYIQSFVIAFIFCMFNANGRTQCLRSEGTSLHGAESD